MNTSIEYLKIIIGDTQETIRAYDTKAEVLGIILTLSTAITNFGAIASINQPVSCWLKCSWIFALLATLACALVLLPRKNPFKGMMLNGYIPSGVFYLEKILQTPKSHTELKKKIAETQWEDELLYEAMKLSIIRESKCRWVDVALYLTTATISFILIHIVFQFFIK
ncbi:hypothetical protein [Brachymonas sp. M4Q-1]|uniref:hypothetical protein n=1 Tax=Brachymonas sp. M4Q-1 TaxID=3416906 RepID=UPI003CF5517F